MAQNFDYNTIIGRIQVDNSQDIPAQATPSLQNNTFLYGNRRDINTQGFTGETSLPIPIPQANYPIYSYYQTYQLNPNLVANPDSLASWFKNCGYNVNYGLSGLLNANNIIASINNTVTTNVELYFQNSKYSTQNLANQNLNGTISINTPTITTGTLVDINNGSYNILVKSFNGNINGVNDTFTSSLISSNFKTGNGVTLSGSGGLVITGTQTTLGTSVTIDAQIGTFTSLIGKSITGTGIAANTTISAINGTTLTLSLATTTILSSTSLTVASIDYSTLPISLTVKNNVNNVLTFNEDIKFNTTGGTTNITNSVPINCDTVIIFKLPSGATYVDYTALNSTINYTLQAGGIRPNKY